MNIELLFDENVIQDDWIKMEVVMTYNRSVVNNLVVTKIEETLPKFQKKKKIGFLQLVSEHLVLILRINDDYIAMMNFRMVRNQQGTRMEPPSFEGRGGNQGVQGWQDEDPLGDSASYAPMVLPNKCFVMRMSFTIL